MEESLPYLEREPALFPNVRVIMLMGLYNDGAEYNETASEDIATMYQLITE